MAGSKRQIGPFDDGNGLFFQDNAGVVEVVRRTSVTGSPVDNAVTQANWSLDKMDGSGPSRIKIDWTKTQQFAIDFEWLSSGRVRMGVRVRGKIRYVHEFLSANVLDKVYMSTPNLPLRYQLIAPASSTPVSMECICGTVISEGGVTNLGVSRYKSTAGTHVATTTQDTVYAVVGIRLKSTHLDAQIKMVSMSLVEHLGTKEFEWILMFNPTVAGTFTYTNETNSAVQTATGAVANTVTGGTAIDGGHGSSAQKGGETNADTLENALRLGAAIDGTVDEIVLCVRPIGGSTVVNIEGSLTWREAP